ncbi:helix-turn-helix domain-containing protein [Paenibacillus baekrokdamisoli]|uniref:helix-turn-helix domain-containing protein n=2 Tax=Paenibacillus baekrokdamisoli TaxID=1712516 RepID=UPI001E5C41DF|nr:helix-turn-helix domain-containing protein [Paenibacillus baekrokdamisoli]
MSNTVNNYEKQFRLLDDIASNLFFGANIPLLERNRSNFMAMNNLTSEIKVILANYNNLNLDNLFFYNDSYSFIIEKGGLTEVADMFEDHYINPQYNAAFWKKQLEEDYHMRIFPAAQFQKRNINGKVEQAGTYFPVIVKNSLQKNSYIAAFIDADEIYLNSHFSDNNLFYIEDEHGKRFFSTSLIKALTNFRAAGNGEAYDSNNNNYYFYQTGEKSKLTYVSVTPNQQIASTVSRLSLLLLILFALSLVVSLLISILFSIRFKLPVQRMLESLQKMNPNFNFNSTIREYTQIGDKLKSIIVSTQKINQDLQMKDSLLKTYSYWNKVKNIPLEHKEMQNLIDNTQPFYFVMYQLQSIRSGQQISAAEMNKTAHFVDLINSTILLRFKQSETLQIEKDLMVSIIFDDDPLPIQEMLFATLQDLVRLFNDQNESYVTIATNPRLRNHSDFTNAYEETLEMIHERKLNANTQLITELDGEKNGLQIPPSELKKLSAHLAAGNATDIMQIIHRLLQRLHTKGRAVEYRKMANDISSEILLVLMSQKIEVGDLLSELAPYEQIKEFVTIDQYFFFYRVLIERAVALINNKKADKDPIVDYVLAYMERHSGEDISQEDIASKLNISIGYMGKYIKNKTGKTFNEYLEDIRISKAKVILVESDDKIHEIANKVGYHNANSFTRMFKRITGVTPGEYRLEKRAESDTSLQIPTIL